MDKIINNQERIALPRGFTKVLASRFGVTTRAINNYLNFSVNNDKAKEVRRVAQKEFYGVYIPKDYTPEL